jgi:hypothetical protein
LARTSVWELDIDVAAGSPNWKVNPFGIDQCQSKYPITFEIERFDDDCPTVVKCERHYNSFIV